MATTLQSVPFTLTPKDKDGNAVDLVKFPTALTAVAWSADNPAFTLTVAADSLSASVAAIDPAVGGDVVVSVKGTAVDGSTVSDTAPSQNFAVPVPVVTSLNLAVGAPA